MGKFSKSVPFEVGDTVTYVSRSPYGFLSSGTKCKVLKIEPGLFPNDFYVTVKAGGKKYSAYHWRFAK